jgi:YHS domain-containing protein
MKRFLSPARLFVAAALTAVSLASVSKAEEEKPKPYPLKKCVVSGEAFEGSDMTPYQFVYKGQTIKLCCKGCLDDFNKEPEKFLKKIEEGAKKHDQ